LDEIGWSKPLTKPLADLSDKTKQTGTKERKHTQKGIMSSMTSLALAGIDPPARPTRTNDKVLKRKPPENAVAERTRKKAKRPDDSDAEREERTCILLDQY
jgi:hypothetical protein